MSWSFRVVNAKPFVSDSFGTRKKELRIAPAVLNPAYVAQRKLPNIKLPDPMQTSFLYAENKMNKHIFFLHVAK